MSFRHLLILVMVLLAQVLAQRDGTCFRDPALKRAKRKVCPDSRFTIHKMKLTGLFNRRLQKHPFFKGERVKLCVSGTATNIDRPIKHLQVSVHGGLDAGLIGGILGSLTQRSFCELNTDGCQSMVPPCQPGQPALVPNQDFCFCSTITVPTWAPELDDVTARVRLLGSEVPISGQCEEEYDNNKIRSKGKQVLACVDIPVRIRDPSKRPRKRPGNGK